MYMSSISFFNTKAEAEARFATLQEQPARLGASKRCLELHKDGSATIVYLREKPVQPWQAVYVGSAVQP